MIKFWNQIIEIVLFLLVLAISWSVTWTLEIFFEVLTETQNCCITEINFVTISVNMADFEEIKVDQTMPATEDCLNNDVFKKNTIDSKISVQLVDEQLFFNYFQDQEEKLDYLPISNFKNPEAGLSDVKSNKLEFKSGCLWKLADELVTDKDNKKAFFTDCIKPKVKLTDHQSNVKDITESVNPYKQPEIIKCKNTKDEREWSLLYLENCDNITSIKYTDSSETENSNIDDTKTEVGNILGENQSGNWERKAEEKIILMKNDNMKKLKAVSADITHHLEQQYSDLNSVKTADKLAIGKKNNKTSDYINPVVKTTDHHSKTCNAKETVETMSPNKQSEVINCSDTRIEGEWLLRFLDNCDKITNIKCIDSSGFKKSTLGDLKAQDGDVSREKQSRMCIRESYEKIILMENDSMKKLNAPSTDMLSEIEQQYPASSFENVSSNVGSTYKTHKKDNMNKHDLEFSNNKKDLSQQQKSSNKYGDFFSLLQMQVHEIHETDGTSKLNPPQREKMSDFEKFYTASNREKTNCSFSEMHIEDQPNNRDNVSSDLASKEQFVECKKYQKNVYSDTEDSASINLITWEIPAKKLEFQVNLKESEEFPEKAKEKEGNLPEKVQESLKQSDNILSLHENVHLEDIGNFISKKSPIYYDDIALNSTSNKLLVIGGEKQRASFLDQAGSSAGINFSPWEIPDEKTKYKIKQKENEEISVKHDEKNENLFEKHQENIIKQNENNNRVDIKDSGEVQCETKNKESSKQLTENIQSSTSACFQSQYEYIFLSGYNNSAIQSNCSVDISNSENKRESSHEINHQIVEQRKQKPKDFKQSRKQPDTNNSHMPSWEQMYEKEASVSCDPHKSMYSHNMREGNVLQRDSVTPQKGFIRKSILKPQKLGKVKENFFNKRPSKYDLVAADSNSAKTEPCTEQILREKNVSDSCDVKKNMHSKESREVNISENGLNNALKDFVSETKQKLLPLKKISDNLSDKMLPTHILTNVGSSEKSKYEPLKNDYNSVEKPHKHDTMIFGLCSECVPVESNETDWKVRATKILPNGSFARSYKDKSHREKLKPTKEAKAKQQNVPEHSTQTVKKKVSFSDYRRVFSYDSENPVLGTYCSYIERKEENDEKESRTIPKKVPVEIIDGNSSKILKGTSSKIPRTVSTVKTKRTKVGDTSTKINVTHSEIKDTRVENKETLAKSEEQLYFENVGYMEDSSPSNFFEIDLTDNDSLISVENDEAVENDKSPLINLKKKTFPKKFECKAKKWFKHTGTHLKKLPFKKR